MNEVAPRWPLSEPAFYEFHQRRGEIKRKNRRRKEIGRRLEDDGVRLVKRLEGRWNERTRAYSNAAPATGSCSAKWRPRHNVAICIDDRP